MKVYEISPELLQAIANVLSQLPYAQVSQVCDALKALKPVEKEAKE